MKDYKLLFLLGLVVLVFPFLGIPEFFRNSVVAIAGAVLIIYSLYVRMSQKSKNENSIYIESDVVSEKFSEPSSEEEINEEVLEEGIEYEEEIMRRENE